MSDCLTNISLIQEEEKIGDSLVKINDNFEVLRQEACTIERQLNTQQIKTFFYYGPNAATDATSNMNNTSTSRPSNSVIENFVNSSTSLNLPVVSEPNDVAYVIYQKTGFYNAPANIITRTGGGTVPFTRQYTVQIQLYRIIDISRKRAVPIGTRTETRTATEHVGYSWTTDVSDRYDVYVPIYVIYRLTFNGTEYKVNIGYPKFNYGLTNSTTSWNNPSSWTTY